MFRFYFYLLFRYVRGPGFPGTCVPAKSLQLCLLFGIPWTVVCQGISQARILKISVIVIFILSAAKAFDCVDHHKLWKILKEMGIPDHLICLLRNLYAGQEAKLELDMEQTSSK